jgi:hypothetical protein
VDSKRITRKALYNTIGGGRPVHKPKRRWIETVEDDSKKI